MFKDMRYVIRFRPGSRPEGWELVDGKAFTMAYSMQGTPHLEPADDAWPPGAPSSIDLKDAHAIQEPWPPR